MSTQIPRQQILHLAALARLKLSEDEIKSYRQELSAIVDFIGQLRAADVGGLEATEQVTRLNNVSRADTGQPELGLKLEDLALNAELEERQIKVPRVNF